MSSTSKKIESARERKAKKTIANMQSKMEELALNLARQQKALDTRNFFRLSRTQHASRMSSRGNSNSTQSTSSTNLNVSSSGPRKRWSKPQTIIPIITNSHESNSHESHLLNTSPRSSQKNLNIPNSANTRTSTRKRWVKQGSTKSVKDIIVRNNNHNNHNNHKNHNKSRKSSVKSYKTRINEV